MVLLRDFNEKIQDPRLSILKVMHEVVFCLLWLVVFSFSSCNDKIVALTRAGRGMTRLVWFRILFTSVVKSELNVSAFWVLAASGDWATGMKAVIFPFVTTLSRSLTIIKWSSNDWPVFRSWSSDGQNDPVTTPGILAVSLSTSWSWYYAMMTPSSTLWALARTSTRLTLIKPLFARREARAGGAPGSKEWHYCQ